MSKDTKGTGAIGGCQEQHKRHSCYRRCPISGALLPLEDAKQIGEIVSPYAHIGVVFEGFPALCEQSKFAEVLRAYSLRTQLTSGLIIVVVLLQPNKVRRAPGDPAPGRSRTSPITGKKSSRKSQRHGLGGSPDYSTLLAGGWRVWHNKPYGMQRAAEGTTLCYSLTRGSEHI
jgi:hypothetical protein